MANKKSRLKILFQPLVYRIRLILSGHRVIPKVLLLLGMITVYLTFFGSLYHLIESDPIHWTTSLAWALKHLIDPGFIEGDMADPGGVPIIILGVVSILIGLICFMVILLTTVHDLAAHMIRKVSHGVLPPHLNNHLIIVGNSEKVIPYFEVATLIDTLKSEANAEDIVFVLTDEGALKKLSEYEQPNCHLFEITESDLRMGYSDLQAESACQIVLLESDKSDLGLRIRFIDQILEERLNSSSTSELVLTVENSTKKAEELLHTLISSSDIEKAKINLESVNNNELKARSLLLSEAFHDKVYHGSSSIKPPIIFMDGWSGLSRGLILQIRSFGLYLPDQHTRVVLIYRTSREKRMYEEVISEWFEDFTDDHYFKSLNVSAIELLNVDDIDECCKDQTCSAIIVSGNDDNRVITKSIEWSEDPLFKIAKGQTEPKLLLIADVSDGSPYRFEKYTNTRLKFSLTPSKLDLTREVVALDKIPQSTHEAYLKETIRQNKLLKDANGEIIKASHRPWNLLNHEIKGWNRSTADHLVIKVSYLASKWSLAPAEFNKQGKILRMSSELKDKLNEMIIAYNQAKELVLVSYLNDQGVEKKKLDSKLYAQELSKSEILRTLETLSEWEHDRWSSERYIHQWRFGNNGIRKHSNLVPYEKLDEGTKAYDRDTIIKGLHNRIQTYESI